MPKTCENIPKSRDFRPNSRFSLKFEIFAEIQDFCPNFRFSLKNVQKYFPAAAEPQDLCNRCGRRRSGRCHGPRAAAAAAAVSAAPEIRNLLYLKSTWNRY